MNTIDPKRAGFALGATCGVFYIGCVLVMLTVPKDSVVRFFNSIMHGWDVEPIMRWDAPGWEAVLGAVEFSILGWLFGALGAVLFNLSGWRRRS